MSYLLGFIDYERSSGWKYNGAAFSLDRVHALLAEIGDPHRAGKYVHVAGTNGKGTVSSIVAKTLTLAGSSTGLFTSPHLLGFRERIRIDGRAISRSDIVEGVGRIRAAVGNASGLTFFEVWTALAFDYFRRRGTDISVMEVGMGGRLDTTNVITPEVSVITSLSMDHRGILGNTLAEIAGEKAGIIKPGVPVVTAPQPPEAIQVIERVALSSGARIIRVGKDVTFSIHDNRLDYHGITWHIEDIDIPIGGGTRFVNGAVALAALEVLADSVSGITSGLARRGIETVKWPGRFQKIAEKPEVIVDGACNIDAMRDVCSSMTARCPRETTVALVAMCRDKDVAEVIAELAGCASRFVVTKVDNPRMVDPEKLASYIPGDVETIVESDAGIAYRKARDLAGTDGTVIATGSLYLVGDVLRRTGIHSIERI